MIKMQPFRIVSSLAPLVALLIQLSISASSSRLELTALCRGDKVKLRTLEHIETLISQVDLVGERCSDRVKDALKEMGKLIEKSKDGVCTKDKAQAITQFVDKHLRNSANRQLPKPLVKFVIAYGMKVSGICSRLMVKGFAADANEKLQFEPEWIDHMAELYWHLSDESPLGVILHPLIKTGELILPVDLMQAMPGLVDHVNLLMPNVMGFDRLKLACERVFQPLYEPVLLPLAHLIRAGFNNRAHYWQRTLRKQGHFWSRTVFLCEIAKMVEVDVEQKAELTSEEKKEIATELRRALKSLRRGEINDWESEHLTPLSMEVTPFHTGNLIYGRFDFSMRSLVRAYDANKCHRQLLRERILKRSFRVFRRLFQRRGFSAVTMKILDGVKVKKGFDRNAARLEIAKKDLIRLIQSPSSTSWAYKLLVSTPTAIKDLLMALIVGLTLLLPTAVIELTTTRDFKDKYHDFLEHFANDWLQIHLY